MSLPPPAGGLQPDSLPCPVCGYAGAYRAASPEPSVRCPRCNYDLEGAPGRPDPFRSRVLLLLLGVVALCWVASLLVVMAAR